MFSLQSFSAQKAGVADGAVSIALAKLRGLLTDLLHSPETGVVFARSSDLTTINAGQVVAYSAAGPNLVAKAVTGSLDVPLEKGFAVSLSNSIATGGWGFFRFAGVADVTMKALDPVGPGDALYVSDVPGLVTTVPGPRQLGICLNSNDYGPLNSVIRMLILKCCLSGLRPIAID